LKRSKPTLDLSALNSLFDYDDEQEPPAPSPPPRRSTIVRPLPQPEPPRLLAPARPVPQRPVPKPPAKQVVKKVAAPKSKLRTKVELKALAALLNNGVVTEKPAPPPITVVQAPPRPAPVDETRQSPMPAADVIRNFDWDKVDLDATAIKLRDLMKDGVPDAIRYTYKDDVLLVFGLTTELMDGALRQPERVEIRPESFDKDKRYPVLAFHRGDVQVILGLRQPVTPRVIAAYAISRLQHDTHRVGYTGGGGSKGDKGLPTTPRQVVTRLRAQGAKVELNPLQEGSPVEVFYQDKSVGKISTGTVPRATCQSDYQRVLRRMAAMDSRT
jgi:hypothetical protein